MPVRPEFIVERQGKQMVLYAGLLDLAHDEGLQSIETQLIAVPMDENNNVAICTAKVTMRVEEAVPSDPTKPITHIIKTFTGIGDACPSNVGPIGKNALIRMAETRAKARALRDATNIGVTALEEMDDDTSRQPEGKVIGHGTPPQAPRPAQVQQPARPTPQAPVQPPIQRAPQQHPQPLPEQLRQPTPAQEAAQIADLPESVARLASSAQIAYRTWRDEIGKADDAKLEQLHNALNDKLSERRIPPQVFDALMDEIGKRSLLLENGGTTPDV
jgi:hypothetical protein